MLISSPKRLLPFLCSFVLSSIFATYVYFFFTISFSNNQTRISGITSADLVTFSKHAINNTVVIVPVNSGHLHWANNLLCSLLLTSFDTTNLVFWTLDDDAQKALKGRGYATYRDPSLFGTSDNENYRGDTSNYKRMMRERPKFFIDFLSTGYDLLMLDADTIFWQSPLELLRDTSSSQAADFVYSTDSREFYQVHNAFQDPRRRGDYVPPICNGIFWARSSKKTVQLYREMLAVFDGSWHSEMYRWKTGFWDDQRGMDVLLNDGRARVVEPYPDGVSQDMVSLPPETGGDLGVRLLDQTEVVNGHLLRNRREKYISNLERLGYEGRERIAAHFNWNTKETSKEEGAEAMGLLFVDEKGRCKGKA